MMNFVFVDNGESYRTGEVKETVGEYFIVQFDCMNDPTTPMPAEMVHISEMCMTLPPDGFKAWSFFPSVEARQKYLDWLDAPSTHPRPKIVSINDKPVGEA